MSLLFGTSGWSYKEWVGPLYDTKKKMFSRYTELFKTSEIDRSWYKSCIVIFLITISLCSYTVNFSSEIRTVSSSELKNYLFTVAWMTDTQYYSRSYPDILKQVVYWINSQANEGKIQYVVHTGDIVDDDGDITQWIAFTSTWHNLTVENNVLGGNHDNWHDKNWVNYNHYFPNSTFYYVLKGNYLFVLLSWQTIRRSDVQSWLHGVILLHPYAKIIVLTHAYMNTRELIDDGPYLSNFLNKYNRTFSVWCGHHAPLTKIINRQDQNVKGICHNFQYYKNGGNGYLILADMYENGYYMHLHSVCDGFDGKGKGNGYELTVLYSPEKVPSSNSTEEINGTIIIPSITIICLLIPLFKDLHKTRPRFMQGA
jgi:hypothetical protein